MVKHAIFVMPEYTLGGAEAQERMLIEALCAKEYLVDVYILNLYGVKEDANLLSDRKRLQGVNYHELGLKGASLYECRAKIKVEMSGYFNRSAYAVAFLFHEYTVPLIPFFHSLQIRAIYSERLDGTWVTTEPLFAKALSECDVLTCNSLPAKKKMEDKFGRGVYEIKNGKRTSGRINRERPKVISHLLVPCRVSRVKNLGIIVELMNSFPDENYHVRFAGEKEDLEYHAELMRQINMFGLSERVEFLGYISEMETQYDWADMIILPSLQEGTPNVVLEAFSRDLAVVVSDIPAEREIVEDNNLRFAPYDVKALKESIDYVSEMSQSAYDQMIETHYTLVTTEYSVGKMTQSFIDLAEEMMDKELPDYSISKMEYERDEFDRLVFEFGKKEKLCNLLFRWMKKSRCGCDIASYCKKMGWKAVSIYGFKGSGSILYDELRKSDIRIVSIIDRNAEGLQMIKGVIPPEKVGESRQDAIIVTIVDEFQRIKSVLEVYSDCKIVSLWDVINNM